jgi:hypothetical protein
LKLKEGVVSIVLFSLLTTTARADQGRFLHAALHFVFADCFSGRRHLDSDFPQAPQIYRRLLPDPGWAAWALGSLTHSQQRLLKTGVRLIKHSRYYWLLLAERHLTRRLVGAMLQRIAALPSPAW